VATAVIVGGLTLIGTLVTLAWGKRNPPLAKTDAEDEREVVRQLAGHHDNPVVVDLSKAVSSLARSLERLDARTAALEGEQPQLRSQIKDMESKIARLVDERLILIAWGRDSTAPPPRPLPPGVVVD
jgi:predicted RNase H-like nuclease (RuvC/YqgF family)